MLLLYIIIDNIGQKIVFTKMLRNWKKQFSHNPCLDNIEFVFKSRLVNDKYVFRPKKVSQENSTDSSNQNITYSFKDNSEISFVRPTSGIVIDRFIQYRVRYDGIQAQDNSNNGSFYVLSLEVANCNENDRQQSYMTCPGLLYQKKSKENGVSDSNITTEKDMLKALDYYFHLVTTTGKAGVYIKKRISPYHYVWYHWRWFISSFICDTVAQEQLEGCAGKKCPILHT